MCADSSSAGHSENLARKHDSASRQPSMSSRDRSPVAAACSSRACFSLAASSFLACARSLCGSGGTVTQKVQRLYYLQAGQHLSF